MDPICDGYVLESIDSEIRSRIWYSNRSVNFALYRVSDSNRGTTILQITLEETCIQKFH